MSRTGSDDWTNRLQKDGSPVLPYFFPNLVIPSDYQSDWPSWNAGMTRPNPWPPARFPWQFENGPLVPQPPTPSVTDRAARMQRGQLPRYLFRCFTSSSGGAWLPQFNYRLNMADRVIPHFFLDSPTGVPTMNLDNFQRTYPDRLQAHLVGSIKYLSAFSSWTPSLMVAYLFAGAANDSSARIAIIDTTLIQNEIYCTTHYGPTGSSQGQVHNRELPWEYHVYGPVMGEGFYSVPRADIASLWNIPPHVQSAPITDADVAAAKSIAQRFVSPAWANEASDVIIQVATNLISGWFWASSRCVSRPGLRPLTNIETDRIISGLFPELVDRTTRNTVPLIPGGLVNSSYSFEWLYMSFILLQTMEAITQDSMTR